jgi:hypothetical protein
MTKDDILEMARETGMELYGHGRDQTNFVFILCRFAKAVAAAEREACAKVADIVAREVDDTNGTATYIAAAIRARGER